MVSSTSVCARCAVIRCDGQSPCSRCSRLGHICEPQQPGRPAAEAQSLARRRPRASRSRGGCLSCKARKKKCDEIRPRCSDCRRLSIQCEWNPPAGSAASRTIAPPPSPTQSSSEPADSLTLEFVVSDCLPQPDPSFSSESFLATLFDDPTLAIASPSLLDADWLPGPVKPPAGYLNPHLHHDEDRSLFNHFVHVVARALSRSTAGRERNPFLAILLPMAAASETMTSVVLGLSGCHWRRVYPGIWRRALAHQGKALTQVSGRMAQQRGRPFSLETCATILLLCLAELLDGTSRAWTWHLKAASSLVTSESMSLLQSTPEGSFCMHLFHYLDAMSTVSRCRPSLLRAGERLADVTGAHPRSLSQSLRGGAFSTDSVSGIPGPLLEHLGRINLLAAHRSHRVDELSEIGFQTAAAHVRSQLDAWRVQDDTYSDVTLDPGPGTSSPDADRAVTAFEWAVRLRLHQIVNGYSPYHAAVEEALSHILPAVMAVPYGSPVEGTLLFPLVMAGACSLDLERRMVVKERLMVMESTLGFGHIPQARQLLETVWAGEGDEDWNWARVRYNLFPGMVFV